MKIALKHVYYHMRNRSPVQVRCMRQGAQGPCTGMTLRDGMGREVGEGFRMGDRCTPMAESCQYMAKPTTLPLQYCKVISLQLNTFIKKIIYDSCTYTKRQRETNGLRYSQKFSIFKIQLFWIFQLKNCRCLYVCLK